MRICITGICGYVGSKLAMQFSNISPKIQVFGIDNLSRRGSEYNVKSLKDKGIQVIHGDIRSIHDVLNLPHADWVIDCAANPSVMAGSKGSAVSPEQLIEHNLIGTINILAFCRQHACGLILLSTSRVYSIPELLAIPLEEQENRLTVASSCHQKGILNSGISEDFPTSGPISVYGATKLACEALAIEYHHSFGIPLWINRCGVIGGPGQFGKIDQGIFSFWVYSWYLQRSLKYIGFGGHGKQVRDVMLAEDLGNLIWRQIENPDHNAPSIINVGGGIAGSLSLKETSIICKREFKTELKIAPEPENRPNDIPYFVMNNELVKKSWDWQPSLSGAEIISQLCTWTSANSDFVKNLFSE